MRRVPPSWAKTHCHIPHTEYGLGWYHTEAWRARLIMAAFHFDEDGCMDWAVNNGLITC